MSDRLPPLTALRAFDAAARHMSFAKAADELGVTPAALSFQIKSLEDHLGTAVFRRLNRAVELTEAGRHLAPGAAEAFQTLSRAWRTTRRLNDASTLTVTAGPAFTSKWLAPRLFDFAQAHPGIELRFSATLRLVDFDQDEVDAAIRFGLGPDEGVYADPLNREWVTPMMAPHLARHLKSPSDLTQSVLIHDDSIAFLKSKVDWEGWSRAAGVPLNTRAGPRFSQADHAIDAAIAGAGVVLGRVSLATLALETGQLVAPFELGLVSDAHFRFVCPLGTEIRPSVAAFHQWIKNAMGASAPYEKGRLLIMSKDIPT